MASEDSDELVSRFSPIHRLDDLDNLQQTLTGQMATVGDQFDAGRELLKVAPLRRPQRMLLKERNDPLEEILPTTDGVAMQVLPVVV
jgi:hypothetical protein